MPAGSFSSNLYLQDLCLPSLTTMARTHQWQVTQVLKLRALFLLSNPQWRRINRTLDLTKPYEVTTFDWRQVADLGLTSNNTDEKGKNTVIKM